MIQFHFTWKQLSVIARMTRLHCWFRFHEGSIKKEQIVVFLRALKRHLKQRLLIVWDGLRAHRSKLVRNYLDSSKGHLQATFLPPSAPDLNPGENLWAWLKRHALANFCPDNLSESQLTEVVFSLSKRKIGGLRSEGRH